MADSGFGASQPLVKAYQELNAGYIDLVGSMSLLRALSIIEVGGLSERELLVQALQVLVLNQDLERCSVYLLENGTLTNAAGRDWRDLIEVHEAQRGELRRFALGEGLIGLAAQAGVIQHCRDCATDPRFVSNGSKPIFGSLVAVPVRANGETLGVLNVSHPHAHFFSTDHERALQVFCNFLGQMMMTRRLLGRMDRLVRERTEQLERALAEAEELKHRYAELSVVDELTGLHNRRYFFPEARSAVARALRYGSPLCVIVLDIDLFKQINDTWGHGVGDEVLRRFAHLLRLQCRESDLVARFGGEEFIIALPETDLEGGRMLAERIRLAARSLGVAAGGHPVHITASLGLAHLASGEVGVDSDSDEVLERLIREADQALYFGKHNGRDQCRYYPEIACLL